MRKLQNIRRGTLNLPLRFLIYGSEGVGKSTLASHFASPIFFDLEDGTSRLDVARYTFGDDKSHAPTTYNEILNALDDLKESDHEFKTLVIDTIDNVEALIWQHVCQVDSGRKTELNPKAKKLVSIEDYGWHKGYTRSAEEFRMMLAALDRLRQHKGMTIVLLSHSIIKLFHNPEGEDYDRYWLRVENKAASQIKDWSDIVAFASFETSVKEVGSKAKGFSTGRRILNLAETAAYSAKTRVKIPAEIEMPEMDPIASLRDAIQQAQKQRKAA